MKSNLFAMQVLGLIAFIPAFIFLEFNHNKAASTVKKTASFVNERKQQQPVVKKQLADIEHLPSQIFFLYY